MAKKTKTDTKTKVKTGKLFKDKKVITVSKNTHKVRKGKGRQHYETPAIEGADTSSCSSEISKLNQEIFGTDYCD